MEIKRRPVDRQMVLFLLLCKNLKKLLIHYLNVEILLLWLMKHIVDNMV